MAIPIDNIENTLSKQEQQFSDLVEGTEKKVVWYDGVKQSELAVVYLHGFSASRQEISPVPELLAKQLNANIFYTRLKGHGRSEQAMLLGSAQDWVNDAREAYEIAATIGKKIILLSTSTGGTLATWLIAQPFANNIVANIMVSPNFGIKNKATLLLQYPLGLKLARWVNGPYHSFEPYNITHKNYWTEKYRLEAVIPVIELVKMIWKMDNSAITTPQLIIYSAKDEVVDSKSTVKLAKRFNQTNLKLINFTQSTDPSQHVLAGDACSPATNRILTQTIIDFISSLQTDQAIKN